MIITPIKTRKLIPPKDDLLSVIRESIPSLKEKSVLVITSKVISIWEGRCIAKELVPDKDKLIVAEADLYLPRTGPFQWVMHTIKNNVFIPTSGIDESNGNGFYILWPKNPKHTAKKLYEWVRETYRVRECGIIITDSHTIPLRRGVMGISLAHYGFSPLNDYRGKEDLFGRELVIRGSEERLAPILMTALATGLALLPIARGGTRAGYETEHLDENREPGRPACTRRRPPRTQRFRGSHRRPSARSKS